MLTNIPHDIQMILFWNGGIVIGSLVLITCVITSAITTWIFLNRK